MVNVETLIRQVASWTILARHTHGSPKISADFRGRGLHFTHAARDARPLAGVDQKKEQHCRERDDERCAKHGRSRGFHGICESILKDVEPETEKNDYEETG